MSRSQSSTRSAGKASAQAGFSLPELLVSMLVMSFIAAGVVGLIYTTSDVNFRLNHKVNNVLMARQALDRIEAKVRMARFVGDLSGSLIDTGSGHTVTRGTNYFPSECNPLYRCDSAGTWPNNWPAPPYLTSSTTLILQVPVFDANGFPTSVQFAGTEESRSVHRPLLENVDTYVYKVLPDSSRKGEFIIQESIFPGQPPPAPASKKEYSPCWTIARGIVGPVDQDGNPRIFQYIVRTDAKETPYDWFDAESGPAIAGVVLNLELKSPEAGNLPAAVLGIKSVVYLKNSTEGTVCGAGGSAETAAPDPGRT